MKTQAIAATFVVVLLMFCQTGFGALLTYSFDDGHISVYTENFPF